MTRVLHNRNPKACVKASFEHPADKEALIILPDLAVLISVFARKSMDTVAATVALTVVGNGRGRCDH